MLLNLVNHNFITILTHKQQLKLRHYKIYLNAYLSCKILRALPVRSSMLTGFTSTILKLWLLISKFQRFIRRSSADIKVSPSLQNKNERNSPECWMSRMWWQKRAHISDLNIEKNYLAVYPQQQYKTTQKIIIMQNHFF